ncbi:long-chain fatty acid transport protein [Endobacter medicaginis]|uniref:Long-chain fatty acid transport protein n=1 Tax=Endobacter medicaginis TaxID=1181271 RepID=A0A839V5E7_9PROT|nr:outer membrane protein transport protein [Endobacter medicaginis]MBB3174671.1 long-chain fatty acid transport protein [Endobacter medicaginis]MCX5474934.1 outer membrane protein transport protein [Endobacter medicaginis]NVN28944.1 outer membrane protein transport protein [Endobacter medicaginis]
MSSAAIRILRRATFLATTSLTLAALAPSAMASGLALRDTDPATTANAYIGGVSRASDASTAYLNPAGMAWLDDNEMETTVTYVHPSSRFRDGYGSGGLSGVVSGATSASAIDPAVTGSAFGVFKLGDRWRIGYGFTTPYGERADYPSNWVGRYNSLVTSLTDYNLSAAVSYKVNSHLSLGFGPQMNFLEGRFTEALDLGALTADPLNQTIGAISGNGFGFGYYAGLIYRFDDRTQFGVTYRSRTTVNLSGKQKITSSDAIINNPLLHPVFVSQSGHVAAEVTLPDTVTFGLTHWFSPRLAVMAEAQWTHWSLLPQLTFHSDAVANSSIAVGWKNTWMGGVGALYKLTPALGLRGGFSYDQSPSTYANRISRTPDTSRYMLAGGVEYRMTRGLTLNAAYAHLFTPDGRINETDSSLIGSHTVTGIYKNKADVVSVGMITHF